MAQKLTDKTELTSVDIDDFIHVVDVSDTTGSVEWTSKKVQMSNISKAILKQYLWDWTDFTVTWTNWTTIRAVAIPYQTSNWIWRMQIEITWGYNFGTVQTKVISVSGIQFTVLEGVHADSQSSVIPIWGNTEATSTNINLYASSAANWATFSVAIFADVELDSKPSWAD